METQPNNAPPAKHEHAPKNKGEHSPLDTIKKYIGFAAAVISLGSAIFGVLSYQADKRAHAHEVADLLAAGQTERSGHDYEGAWKSLASAAKIIDNEKGLVKLLGGLDTEQEKVQSAQEELGMEWLRALVPTHLPEPGSHLPEYQYPQVPDSLLSALSSAAGHASGSHKADLLAHLGWGYCLKLINKAKDQHPDNYFREAVALEADNPYAKSFWGDCMLFSVAPFKIEEMAAQAQPYFVAALSSKRATGPLRAWVRGLQFTAFHVAPLAQREAPWWQAVTEMVKAQEPLDAGMLLTDLQTEYVLTRDADHSLAVFQKNLDRVLNFAPIEEHVQLLQMLVDQIDPNAPADHNNDSRLMRQIALATALEKAGKPSQALAVWRDAQARLHAGAGDNRRNLGPGIDAAVTRLAAAPAT